MADPFNLGFDIEPLPPMDGVEAPDSTPPALLGADGEQKSPEPRRISNLLPIPGQPRRFDNLLPTGEPKRYVFVGDAPKEKGMSPASQPAGSPPVLPGMMEPIEGRSPSAISQVPDMPAREQAEVGRVQPVLGNSPTLAGDIVGLGRAVPEMPLPAPEIEHPVPAMGVMGGVESYNGTDTLMQVIQGNRLESPFPFNHSSAPPGFRNWLPGDEAGG